MTGNSDKAPKKVKERKQSPQERLEAMRYNHMMYGPTEGELKLNPKKVDFGASFLKHPKFQSLMTAFKNGTAFKFDITASGKISTIDTDGSHISFDGKVLFYSRALNKYEDNLLLDRGSAVQLQTTDAVVHLLFAVLRSLPELGEPQFSYLHHKLYHGTGSLETSSTEQGSNVLVGPYKHNKTHEKIRY
jgi:hypothetical protein